MSLGTLRQKLLRELKEYYVSRFQDDLIKFLSIYRKGDRSNVLYKNGYLLYFSADATVENPISVISRYDYRKYFAVIFAYYHACLCIMAKYSLGEQFCRCTGFPMIYNGSDGLTDAYSTMSHLKMLPGENGPLDGLMVAETVWACEDFMKDEFKVFVCGEQKDPIDLYAPREYAEIVKKWKNSFEEKPKEEGEDSQKSKKPTLWGLMRESMDAFCKSLCGKGREEILYEMGPF